MSDLHTAIRVGKAWSNLGWAVQGQMEDVLEGDDPADKNPNALKLIRDYLDRLYELGAIEDYEHEEIMDLFDV